MLILLSCFGKNRVGMHIPSLILPQYECLQFQTHYLWGFGARSISFTRMASGILDRRRVLVLTMTHVLHIMKIARFSKRDLTVPSDAHAWGEGRADTVKGPALRNACEVLIADNQLAF